MTIAIRIVLAVVLIGAATSVAVVTRDPAAPFLPPHSSPTPTIEATPTASPTPSPLATPTPSPTPSATLPLPSLPEITLPPLPSVPPLPSLPEVSLEPLPATLLPCVPLVELCL